MERMAPSKQYMLNRALIELEAVKSRVSATDKHSIDIAITEIQNVLHELEEVPVRVEVDADVEL